MKSNLAIAIVAGGTLLGAACFVVGVDNWTGASLSVAFEVCFAALGLVVGALTVWYGGHKALLVIPGAYILFILALPFVDGSPVKPAVRAVREIRPGMTEPEVRAVLDHYFPEQGRFKRPTIPALHGDVLSFVLDQHDGRYNAAVVWVKFSAGKSVSAGFDPD